ncbi:hypothetical protein WJX74_009588 [Apatococcus lobatus]|uniref:RNase H type-1 domain-containing protein n=1 Tax=Apatococcus lobatus TaxID=904363 RepID=A0AAW1QD82_9CHLO
MQWWADNLLAANGSRWWKRTSTIRIAGDASDIGYAAYTLPGTFEWTMQTSFSQSERECMHRAIQGQDIFSSTHRELTNICIALEALIQQHLTHMQHGGLQWFTDSQVAVALLKGLKGSGECLQEVKAIYSMLMTHDMEVDWQWLPRSHQIMELADAYSKEIDAGDIIMSPTAVKFICLSPLAGSSKVTWGNLNLPTPDPSAMLGAILPTGRRPMLASYTDKAPMALFNQQGQVMLKFPTVMASANSHSERSGHAFVWDEATGRPSLPSIAEFQLLMGLSPGALEAPGKDHMLLSLTRTCASQEWPRLRKWSGVTLTKVPGISSMAGWRRGLSAAPDSSKGARGWAHAAVGEQGSPMRRGPCQLQEQAY